MRYAEMLHGVVGKGRPQTLRFVVIKAIKDTFIAINICRDVGEKDFIMAFRAEQEGQYSNLVGARSLIAFYCIFHILLELDLEFVGLLKKEVFLPAVHQICMDGRWLSKILG